MTNDLTAILERARASQGTESSSSGADGDRQKLLRIAQEFESMLLGQVLKDMRRAGKWDEEEGDGNGDSLGFNSESLFEMADQEFAGHLTRVQGLGLSKQLLEAFDRMQISAKAPIASSLTMGGGATQPSLPELPELPEAPDVVPVTLPPPPTPRGGPEPVVGSPTVPTVDGQVTSNFGWRRDPFTGQSRFHRGVDLAAVYGQDVQAARAGHVVFSGGQGGYGNTVVIEHTDGTRSRYAHLSEITVGQGDVVDAGQPVGRAGHSGRATGTHVHFEVTSATGQPMAPAGWLKKT